MIGLLLLAACKVELFASLPEAEANEVVALLLQDGLSASKSEAKDGSSAISVEELEFPRAVAVLKQHGLPRKKFQTISDVFQQSGLVSSPVQERARFLWALGQELSSTVSQIDGVLTARVQVVLPDNDVMKRDPTPSSASVFVRYSVHSQAEQLVPQIKSLVANSVEGLTYERVSMVMVAVEPEPLPIESRHPVRKDQLQMAVGLGLLIVVALAFYVFRSRISSLFRHTTQSVKR
ncbi:MAG: type III secretion system inner membrane ring lipoprotein SctJ [Janthinobacterium lividum]